jgi:hypothetical protein
MIEPNANQDVETRSPTNIESTRLMKNLFICALLCG